MLQDRGDSLEGKRCLILGSGKVARCLAQKLQQLGAIPLSFSDASGHVYEPSGITEGNLRTINKIKDERGMSATAILLDDKGTVGKLYGAKTTPHMFIVDKDGKIAYQGAIDDQPSASEKSLKGATNYVSAAMTSIQKGEAVKTASTTPYGCSVKY